MLLPPRVIRQHSRRRGENQLKTSTFIRGGGATFYHSYTINNSILLLSPGGDTVEVRTYNSTYLFFSGLCLSPPQKKRFLRRKKTERTLNLSPYRRYCSKTEKLLSTEIGFTTLGTWLVSPGSPPVSAGTPVDQYLFPETISIKWRCTTMGGHIGTDWY